MIALLLGGAGEEPDEKCIPSGTISSPNFPDKYPNNKHCIWNLMAPAHYKITIEFEEFQLEGTTQCKYDFMQVCWAIKHHYIRLLKTFQKILECL